MNKLKFKVYFNSIEIYINHNWCMIYMLILISNNKYMRRNFGEKLYNKLTTFL